MKLIKNASVCDGSNDTRKVNILFDETILEISENEIHPTGKVEIIDLEGMLLLPGCIDARVHLSEMSGKQELLRAATKLAAKGGFTTIAEDLINANQPLTEPEYLETHIDTMSSNSYVDFGIWGHIRMNDYPSYVDYAYQLWTEGVVGLKVILFSLSDDDEPLGSQEVLDLFSALSDSSVLFAFDPEDGEAIKKILPVWQASGFKPEEGYLAMQDIQGQAIHKVIRRSQDNPIHFFDVVTAPAFDFIMNSVKKYDLSVCINPVYCDISQEKAGGKPSTQQYPPYQSLTDRDMLANALRASKILFISTNSGYVDRDGLSGCLPEMSEASETYWLEHMIPYLLSEFYLKDKITLERLIKITSENGAKRLGLYPRKGSLAVGSDADFTVVSLPSGESVSPSRKTKFSIDKNCKIAQTFVRGNLIYDMNKGHTQKAFIGTYIRRTI